MHLSERLNYIAEHVPPDAGVVDVGTDHAAVPIQLARVNPRRTIIGVEYNLRPYHHAVQKVVNSGLESVVQIRKAYGLGSVAPGEVDVAVIAGLGSATIEEILRKGHRVAKSLTRLILGPMDYPYKLRQYLLLHGYSIVNEGLVHEFRWYEILVAAPKLVEGALGTPVSSLAELHSQLLEAYRNRLGWGQSADVQTLTELLPILSVDPNTAALYLRARREAVNRILNNMPDVPGTNSRRNQLDEKIRILDTLEDRLCGSNKS